MLDRVWIKGNPLALLVGMQIDTATIEGGTDQIRSDQSLSRVRLFATP